MKKHLNKSLTYFQDKETEGQKGKAYITTVYKGPVSSNNYRIFRSNYS